MSLGRAVPWASWEEWRQVGLWLLSEAPGDVQQGLDRVAAWRARGRVPLGVDSTSCLVEAQLRDRAASAAVAGAPGAAPSFAGSSESELRLQYAMAVVRMVNGIADSAQRGRIAASVASLAAAAGLPRILVDLRHEATHNELPSLAALRLAAQHGLAWLQGNYWQRQSDHVHASADRVRALVQEYLDLHLAAATKVAVSAAAAGDSDDSEEEDVRPSAAAAAAAAAASVSAGRRAAGRGGAASGAAQPAASGGGADATSYQAADAKKRRRQLLSEIRSAVPRPAAALVADALLAASAAQTAASGGLGAPSSSSGSTAVAASAAVAERALAAALGHLAAIFPQLPSLLLLGAVRQMAAAAAAEPAAGSGTDASLLSAHLCWLQRLLPSQAQPQMQQLQGGNGSMLGAVKGWAPSAALLQQLLAKALPAQAAATQRAAWLALGTRGGSSGSAAAQPASSEAGLASGGGEGSAGRRANAAASVAEALRQAVVLLLACAGQGPASRAATSLAALAPGPSAAAAPEAQPAAQLEAAANSQQMLLARLQQQQQQQQQEGQQQPAAGQPPRKRWRHADTWQPCALGMLPCAADPNGRLPPLDPPALLDLPAPFVEHQAAEAAAAAAAEAAAAAASSKAGQPRGPQQSAAAVLLRELREGPLQEVGPWPAPDRFTAAAACAEPGGAGPAVLEAEPRVQLPRQVALLV